MSAPMKILAGMAGGVVAGMVARTVFAPSPVLDWFTENVAHFTGQLFIRLIFMVVIPLVVSSLVLGVVELGDVRRLGRIGLRCLGFTVVLSFTSVLLGVGLVHVVQPGAQVPKELRDGLVQKGAGESTRAVESAKQAAKPVEALLSLLPRNPLKAAVEADMLPLMVFAVVLGMVLTTMPDKKAEPLIRLAESTLAASMRVIEWAMTLAPYGVAALLFAMVVKSGAGLFAGLASYSFCVIAGLGIQCFVVYSILLKAFTNVSPLEFFRKIREAMLTAFSTASSSATLPLSLRVSEEELGIPRQIGSFVLTVGATANQNGTALFEGVTVLFLAQAFGVTLDLQQQLSVVMMSVLAGIGTAGVPGGSLPLIVIVLQSVGVPPEGIGIILGVDRILDMCRTTLNVTGDLVIAQLVAAGERTEDQRAPA